MFTDDLGFLTVKRWHKTKQGGCSHVEHVECGYPNEDQHEFLTHYKWTICRRARVNLSKAHIDNLLDIVSRLDHRYPSLLYCLCSIVQLDLLMIFLSEQNTLSILTVFESR